MATLAELRIRARRRANMETAGSDQFVTDVELDAYLNDGLGELYDLLLQSWGDEYFVSTTTLALTSGTASYALPADFYKLLTVIIDDGQYYHPAPRYRWHDLARLEQLTGSQGGTSVFHLQYGLNSHVQGQITFKPTPQASYTATLHYIPKYTALTTVSGTATDINRWDEYAVIRAAIQMLRKEESLEHAAMLETELARMERRIKALAGSRDAGRAHRIEDTRRDYDDGDVFTVSGLNNDWYW